MTLFGTAGKIREEAAQSGSADNYPAIQELARHCNGYKGADTKRGLAQLAVTLFLYFCLVGVMLLSLRHGAVWPLFFLWLPAGGLLVRLFIVQHDCGHGSFFRTRRANDLAGRFLSLFTFTPYGFWRDAHNKHHAGSGNLNRRGIGSIDTLTVDEYRALPLRKRLTYRFYRHPLVVLGFGPPLHILVFQRLPVGGSLGFFEDYNSLPFKKIWPSVLALDLALALVYGAAALAIGPAQSAMMFLPPVIVAAWIGGWLFFVQHQFEETYWERTGTWGFHEASVLGSSYYVMPKILQWFTGNIGLHHIHHLCSMIPNYRLQDCLDASPELQRMNRLTPAQSLRCANLALWDEAGKKLVSFREAKA